MKKKLLAVAVAGALAAPGLALAQSSVTISGIFKVSLENLKIPGRVGVNTSEMRLADDSSRIIFNVVEDLGGGLQAIGQVDMRVNIEGGGLSAAGNNHVGFRSKTMGRFFIGRQDLHYFNRESNLTDLAGSLRADSMSILPYMQDGTAIANATRTPNVMHYTTPNWGGFTVIAAYSTGSNTQSTATGQGDLASGIRKGSAWHLNPNYASGNWQLGWSYWQAKSDVNGGAPTAAQIVAAGGGGQNQFGDQRSNRLYGSFRIAGFKLGLAWDKSRVRSQATGATSGERTAWSLPISYTMGNNQFHFHYTRARDDRATADNDGSKMIALSYQYTLSKRTSVGLTYAKITNDVGAQYNFFTSATNLTGGASLGNSAGAGVVAGEDPRLFAGTIRHAF